MNVAKQLDSRISALPYVELYGSLCTEHTIKDQTGRLVVLPMSQDYNIQECLDKELYKDMFPNDKYTSSVFILKDGFARVEKTLFSQKLNEAGVKVRPKRYTQKYQMIGWFNAAALGYETNEISDQIIEDIETNVFEVPIPSADKKALIEAEITSYSHEIPKIFKNLESLVKVNWSMFPYCWTVINFTMTYISSCGDPFVISAPLDCIEFSGTINSENSLL